MAQHQDKAGLRPRDAAALTGQATHSLQQALPDLARKRG